MRICFILPMSIALFLGLLLAPTHADASSLAPPAVLEIDGHLLDGPFREFYAANDGMASYGVPLADAHFDLISGLLVQEFTYARFELHPGGVALTRLGSLLAANRADEPWFQELAANAVAPGRSYIAETGHSIGGAFAWYRQSNSGLPIGYPISEEFSELQGDGQALLVQYFERARLSYHPDARGTADEVQRAPLGLWYADQLLGSALRARGRPLQPLGSARLPFNPHSSTGVNIALAAEHLHGAIVAPGAELSFIGAIGEVSTATGYVAGPAIVGGELVDTVGGGICTVATLLYRAAWAAGLPIIERRGHSYLLRVYADAPGMDAAVYTPGQDLRIGNDSNERLYVATSVDAESVTVTIWGRGDDRLIQLAAPELQTNEAGSTAINWRTVRAADGSPLRDERVVTHYGLPPATHETENEPVDAPPTSRANEPQ